MSLSAAFGMYSLGAGGGAGAGAGGGATAAGGGAGVGAGAGATGAGAGAGGGGVGAGAAGAGTAATVATGRFGHPARNSARAKQDSRSTAGLNRVCMSVVPSLPGVAPELNFGRSDSG